MAKVWKKLQRADSDFTGNVTGSVNGTAASGVYSTANKPSKSDVGLSNLDNVQQYSSSNKPTKSDVGLSNVTNHAAYHSGNKPTKTDVGLGNLDNSKFSSGKFIGVLAKTDGTAIYDPSDGNFTGKVAGSTASDVKSKAEAAKSAVDGNAAVTMVGGSINIGSGEWTVDTNGNQITKGTITINKDSGGDAGLTLDSGTTGNMQIMMEGANPAIDMGGSSPLGTTTHYLRRGGTGNQCRTFYTTGATVVGCVGFANQPTAYNDQFAIHTASIYDNSSPYNERTLSFDSDGKTGWFSNSKSFAGFTFGTDGTNKGVYIASGGLCVGTTTVGNGTINTSGNIISGAEVEAATNLKAENGGLYLDRSSNDSFIVWQKSGSSTAQMRSVTGGGVKITNSGGSSTWTDWNSSGDATFAKGLDVDGTARTGWHTKDKIFIPPNAFMPNDDNTYYNMAVVDSGGQSKAMYSTLEAYAMYPIPSGYKVTHARVNGTSSVNISMLYGDCSSNSASGCGPPSAIYTNNTYACYSSPVNADDTNGRYFILKWAPTSTNQYLYGAILTIAKI